MSHVLDLTAESINWPCSWGLSFNLSIRSKDANSERRDTNAFEGFVEAQRDLVTRTSFRRSRNWVSPLEYTRYTVELPRGRQKDNLSKTFKEWSSKIRPQSSWPDHCIIFCIKNERKSILGRDTSRLGPSVIQRIFIEQLSCTWISSGWGCWGYNGEQSRQKTSKTCILLGWLEGRDNWKIRKMLYSRG
jgi:hypothetical protein